MNIAILQTDIAWADPNENIRRAEALMWRADPADLYVLPEMWATGFAVDPVGVAEDEETSAALRWMRQTARERQCALSGSLAVRLADGTYRNRHYFVTPEQTVCYDKHHLFSHGHEDRAYTPGTEAVVAQWQGMRFLLLTCYDLRFPVFARYGRAGCYDAIVLVANWPAARQDAWNVLTRARAMENQCYVLAANRVGADPATTYQGGSAVIDPRGRVLAEAPQNSTSAVSAVAEAEVVMRMRQRFRVLDDRDRF